MNRAPIEKPIDRARGGMASDSEAITPGTDDDQRGGDHRVGHDGHHHVRGRGEHHGHDRGDRGTEAEHGEDRRSPLAQGDRGELGADGDARGARPTGPGCSPRPGPSRRGRTSRRTAARPATRTRSSEAARNGRAMKMRRRLRIVHTMRKASANDGGGSSVPVVSRDRPPRARSARDPGPSACRPATTTSSVGTANTKNGARQPNAAASPAPTRRPKIVPMLLAARWIEYTRGLLAIG